MKKWKYSEAVHQLCIGFKKAYDSVRRVVLCNNLIAFGIHMKLIRLIKMCLNEIYSTVWVCKHLSDMFSIKNGLQQGDDLLPLIFNSALEYTIRRVQVNQKGLKLNGTYQLLIYADDVNKWGGSIHTIMKNTEALVVASKQTALEVNADKTKYMVMSQNQNAGQSNNIRTDNSSFVRMEQFKYFVTNLTNQNSIQEEIKSRLK